MRLIDADTLKADLTRFYDNEVTAKQLIDEQPTIPAIPVGWLNDMKPVVSLDHGMLISWLIRKWQKGAWRWRE